MSALQPRASTIEQMLGNLRETFEADAQQRHEAVAELKNSLFEQTLAAIGDKLEAEGRKQQDAIGALKASLLGEVSTSIGERLQADERKQQDAIAQLQTSFEDALGAIGDRLEAEGKKQQDAIAALTASLVVSSSRNEPAAPEPNYAQAPPQTSIIATHEDALPASSIAAMSASPIARSSPADAAAAQASDSPSIAVEPEHSILDLSTPMDSEFPSGPARAADENAAGRHDPTGAIASFPELALSTGAGMQSLQGATAFARDDMRDELSRSTGYLSEARQSLQSAAARSVPDSSKEFFAFRFLRSIGVPSLKKGDTTSYALIAAIALIALLAVAVTVEQLLSRWNSAPGANVGAHSIAANVRAGRFLEAQHQLHRGTWHGRPNAKTQSLAASPSVSPADRTRLAVLADAGNSQAQLLLGLQELGGADKAAAAKWLERAALQGEPVAQYRMGALYAEGRGVPKDDAKAFHWYAAAAQAGNRKAMSNLAVAYAQGNGTAKNPEEAARWFSKAAQLGLVDAQFDLAVLYERGLGVPQSLLDAYRWYLIAAKAGDRESRDRIEALSSQLAPTDRAAAEAAADQFKALPTNARANEPQ